ncbi:4Fe-4S binding protein [Candidatus Uhrbacteria bacterium]|nr:4Fe-4S binding protein [Candidatus Uhrbacteria bacterium]
MNPSTDPARFRPKTSETSKIRVTRYLDLCKSCGECIMKCPVNAISWHKTDIAMLGEPGIYIDLKKCIGCETCERVCPDHAIKITNKRLSSPPFDKGLLKTLVRLNARMIEYGVYFIRTSAGRLKKVGRDSKKTLACILFRTFLRYGDEPVKEDEDR